MIVQVVATIFSYGPHSNMRRGEAHCALVGEGSWPFCFGPEKTQRRQKGGLQNFKIPIFLTVAQDKPNKIPVTYFFKRFYENISGKCVHGMHPSTLQNTLLIFLRHFLMERTRLYTEKEKARLLSEIQHGGLEWLVFLLACGTLPFLTLRKIRCSIFILG